MLQKRIEKVISAQGLTQEGFAQEVGVSLERIKNLVLGRVQRLKPEEAEKIQRRFGYRAIWLMDGKGAMLLTKEEQALLMGAGAGAGLSDASAFIKREDITDKEKISQVQRAFIAYKQRDDAEFEEVLKNMMAEGGVLSTSFAKDDASYVVVPQYNIHASAGGGAIINDEAVVNHLAFKRDWIVRTMGCDPNCVALIETKGDSMSPTIESGDLLLLDTRRDTSPCDGLYVINLRGALLVKRLRIKLTGVVEVVSDNHLKYPPEMVTANELDRLMIVGRVVWHGARV